MANITAARKEVITRVLEGEGASSKGQRRGAFDDAGLAEPLSTLVRKIAKHAHKVTDDDIAAARASGLSEDQVFEVVVCAAIGQAARQYDSAMAALDAATGRH
jgi:hypothetical protein